MIRKKKEKAFAIYPKIYIRSTSINSVTLTIYILWQLQVLVPIKDILDQKIDSFITYILCNQILVRMQQCTETLILYLFCRPKYR